MTNQPELDYISVQTRNGSIMVPYEIRRSKKARSVRISVGLRSQIVLTVPWNVKYQEGLDFLQKQGNWIEKSLNQTSRAESISEYYMKQPYWYAYKIKWRLEITYQGKQARSEMDLERKVVYVRMNRDKEMNQQLMVATRNFASRALKQRTMELAQYTGLIPCSVRVGNQGTRWGSCSSLKTISLNWRLILVPPRLQDHIILHELAHLQEMNHSAAFYKLLNELDANSEVHAKEINEIGSRVMRLGRL